MLSVLGITAPIYLLIAAGFCMVRFGWMAAPDLRVLGRFVAQFCVPALLFRAITRQPLGEVLQTEFLFVYVAGSLLSLALVLVFARRVRGRDMSLAAIQGLGAANSNSAFIGYPVVLQVLGPTAGVALALTTLVENLLIIPLSLALAETGAAGQRPLALLKTTLSALSRNPMILAIAAGLLVSGIGIPIPAVLDSAVGLAAAAAPPTALFVIGGSLVGLKLSGMRGDIALVAGGKLLLHPLCVLGFLLLLPPADPLLRAAALLFAAMPMLSIYPVLAQRHGHDRFCAAALLAATVSSFFTLSLLMAALPADWLLRPR